MTKTRKFWHDQIVHEGVKVINVGFNRDLAKIIKGLCKETCETIILKDVPILSSTSTMGLSGVKKLIIQNVGILQHGAVFAMDDLEVLEIRGSVGRLDTMFCHTCQKLREITISANVFSSERSLIFTSSNNLKTINIQGLFPERFVHVTDNWHTVMPDSEGNIVSKYPFDNYRLTLESKTDEEKEIIKQSLLETSKWVKKVFGHDRHIDYAIGMGASAMWGFIVKIFNSWTRAHKLRKICWEYSQEKERPSVRTLKISESYQADDKCGDIIFYYAPIFTPIFETYRRRFHLWKLAGKGGEIDKMIRLCRWVHESIHHKGDAIPNVHKNLNALMDETCKIGKPGNCLILAICLCEALLSVGIKARYIKGYQRDNDSKQYHVFVSAWSKKFKKWIFLDPTYGAYVMNMDGEMLSPAEIRYNLINDIEMKVNNEADYNGDKTMANTYLKDFLAGNLYHLSTNTISRDSTEEFGVNFRGNWIILSPKGERCYSISGQTITDEAVFWQSPE